MTVSSRARDEIFQLDSRPKIRRPPGPALAAPSDGVAHRQHPDSFSLHGLEPPFSPSLGKRRPKKPQGEKRTWTETKEPLENGFPSRRPTTIRALVETLRGVLR